jgi:hypothetical protein
MCITYTTSQKESNLIFLPNLTGPLTLPKTALLLHCLGKLSSRK